MSPEFNLKKKNFAFISRHFKWGEAGGTTVLFDTRNHTTCNPHDINVKIDIYEDRVKGWFLDIGRSLTSNTHSEFVILQIAISYIEGNQQLREGNNSRGQSGDFFARGVERIFGVNAEDAKVLYGEVRCGLFHQGMTSKKVLLSVDFHNAMIHIDGGIHINANLFLERITEDLQGDLPPKKWTQRRDGFSIKTSSKMGGVQWLGKTEKRGDLIGILSYQQSRWSQKAAIGPQRWPGAWESMPAGCISGRSNLAIMGIRPLLAKAI